MLAIRQRHLPAAALLFWLLLVGTGARALLRYSNTPGRPASPPAFWPGRAIVRPERGLATIVIFVHPQCPCSRATIGELAQVMSQSQGRAVAWIYFYAPGTEPADWTRTPLWRDAAAIPGVHAMEDPDGREARRFGAATSGQVLLYDAAGQLRFDGGITQSRGHLGANDGADAILSLVQSGASERRTAPVFGCSLLGGNGLGGNGE